MKPPQRNPRIRREMDRIPKLIGKLRRAIATEVTTTTTNNPVPTDAVIIPGNTPPHISLAVSPQYLTGTNSNNWYPQIEKTYAQNQIQTRMAIPPMPDRQPVKPDKPLKPRQPRQQHNLKQRQIRPQKPRDPRQTQHHLRRRRRRQIPRRPPPMHPHQHDHGRIPQHHHPHQPQPQPTPPPPPRPPRRTHRSTINHRLSSAHPLNPNPSPDRPAPPHDHAGAAEGTPRITTPTPTRPATRATSTAEAQT